MHDCESLTFRLESYLQRLSELTTRWGDWLAGNERAALAGEPSDLVGLQSQAATLLEECGQLLDGRAQLLEDAETLGLPAGNLKALAKSLPAWQRPSLRHSLAHAQSQLQQLCQLHMSAWVVVSHQMQLYRDTIALLTCGTADRHVYTANAVPQDSGGHLLDASL